MMRMRMSRFDKRISNIKAQKELLKKDVSKKKKELEDCKSEKQSAEDARTILQLAAKETQRNLEIHFSKLVTNSFGIIFDNPYEFKPEFVERRNKTECDLWFVRNGKKLTPRFSSGGSVRNIAAFALRLAYWKLEKSEPIMIFDEPFKNFHKDRLLRVAETIRYLSDELELQMIIITHIPEITQQADKVIEIEGGTVNES
jgi:DNA repair exonuclease SbcCD ATPase subunit